MFIPYTYLPSFGGSLLNVIDNVILYTERDDDDDDDEEELEENKCICILLMSK